jgi:serine/threonine protein kinase
MDSSLTKSEQWQIIDSILDAVLDSHPNERERILREKCGEDQKLKRKIKKLLAATEHLDGFLETPPAKSALELLNATLNESFSGKRFGSYQLLRMIGQGGMGTFYLASGIDDEFHQQVAIKFVPPKFYTNQTVQHFRRERQILAKLEHPNIARLLDGGTTEVKVPFLVREYVQGTTITEYCRRQKLSLKNRLNLFLKVCNAVRFAHQNLIIHRDLKPNNILVTDDGEVKLLDFGIAKLIQPELFDVTTNLTLGANILTPNYASPEQLKGENITTASDVYSLGVIL